MKYFNNITTAEELKKQFRAYCVNMHPDKGGDPEEFKNMMAEYQAAMKNAGAWTKDEEKEAEGIRRGSVIVCIWGPSGETKYVVLSVHGKDIKTVRLFGHDFKSLEDIDYIMSDEYETKESFRTFGKYDRIERLSKEFGCGLYWDDVTNKTYTEQEIANFERIAGNFETWAKNWKADKEEKERIAKEEADREEAAIIAQWSGILEEIPAEFSGKRGVDYFNMTKEERAAQDKARRSVNSKRLAAFKRNIKAVFNHFWPGVKVSVSDNARFFHGSVISWEDGPILEEVENCEVFNYFLGRYFESDPYSDYGTTRSVQSMCRFRKLFGSFSDTEITFNRKLSKDSIANLRQVIAENFPQAEERRAAHEKDEKEDLYFDFSTEGVHPDSEKLKNLCGFEPVETIDFDKATEAEKEVYYMALRKYQDFHSEIMNCLQYNSGKMHYHTLLNILRERYKLEDEQPKKQTEKKAKADRSQKAAKSEKAAEGVDMTAAPAEGLELVEIAGGVAVVGDQRTTYKNRKQIKAHGARWNKEAQQWQATTPEAVAQLREWFGMTEQSAADTEQQDATAQTAQEGAQGNEANATDEQQPASENEPQSAADEPGADEATASDTETCEQVEAVGALASALSFLLNAVISASKEAKEAADQAAASAAEATEHDAAAEREQKRKEAAAILREQINKVSEQVASLSDTLAQMLERLNALESGKDVSEEATEEPQTSETAQDGATAQQQEETTAQRRQKSGSSSGVSLDMLRAAAEDVQRLAESGEHGRAVLSELYTLCACGVTVRDLIDKIRGLNTAETLGREPVGEIRAKRSELRRFARNRAKVVLSPEEFRTLYTWDEGTEAGNGKAA